MISPISSIPSPSIGSLFEEELKQSIDWGPQQLQTLIQDIKKSWPKRNEEEIKKCEKKIQELSEKIRTLVQEKVDSERALKERRVTSVGRFVEWARNKILISWILKIFQCFKIELKTQNELLEKIDSIGEALDEAYREQTNHQLPIQIKKIQEIYETTLIELETRLENGVSRQQAQEFIYTHVFGGEKKFQDLPVLDLNAIKGDLLNGYCSIMEHHLSAPIMRGIDQEGKIFFIIKWQEAGDKTDKKVCKIHTFFERFKNGIWSDAVSYNSTPGIITDIKGFWCQKGQIEGKILKNLQEVVKQLQVSK